MRKAITIGGPGAGKKREDLPWAETAFDEAFRQWMIGFPRKRLPQIYALLKEYQGNKNIVIFQSRKEVDAYLNTRKGNCCARQMRNI